MPLFLICKTNNIVTTSYGSCEDDLIRVKHLEPLLARGERSLSAISNMNVLDSDGSPLLAVLHDEIY